MSDPIEHFRKRLIKQYEENEFEADLCCSAPIPLSTTQNTDNPTEAILSDGVNIGERTQLEIHEEPPINVGDCPNSFPPKEGDEHLVIKERSRNIMQMRAMCQEIIKPKTATGYLIPNSQPEDLGFNLNDAPSTSTQHNETKSPNILKPLNISEVKVKKTGDYPCTSLDDPHLMVIGTNGTRIRRSDWLKINWNLPPSIITGKILTAIFSRDILSTHTLTGRPSPAFIEFDMPEKKPLPADKVADIIEIVTELTNATAKHVRLAITAKCAKEGRRVKKNNIKMPKATDKENETISHINVNMEE